MARGPIKHTCPAIDSQIKSNDAEIKKLREMVDAIEWTIRAFEDSNSFLEEMRTANDELRTWGAEMEDLAEARGKELDELERELSTLQS